MKTYVSALLLCLCGALPGYTQVSSMARVEVKNDLWDNYQTVGLYPFGEAGFMLEAWAFKRENGEDIWRYEKYDQDLVFQGAVKVGIGKGYYREEVTTNANKLYVFSRGRNKAYQFYVIDVSTLEVEKIEGTFNAKFAYSKIQIADGVAYCTGLLGIDPCILALDLTTGNANYHPIKVKDNSPQKVRVVDMQFMQETQELIVTMKGKISKEKSAFYIERLDKQGNLITQYDYFHELESNIINATLRKLPDGRYVISGTYSDQSRFQSGGLYIAIAQEASLQTIKFYNFLDLENFLTHLSESELAAIEAAKQSKGEKKYSFSLPYFFAPHELIESSDGFIFLAEAYKPTYLTEVSVQSGVNTTYALTPASGGGASVKTVQTPSTRSTTSRNFDGYQYTHAFLAKFDETGELIWDQSFNMRQTIRPKQIKRFIQVQSPTDQEISMLFTARDVVVFKTFDQEGELIHDESEEGSQAISNVDQAKWTKSDITFWYDDYFLVFGDQKIVNKAAKGKKKKRRIYFVEKIAYKVE